MLTLSPPTRSLDEVGAPLGTKMLRKHINRVDVQPLKALGGFVLYHLGDDVLSDNNCGNLLQAAWGGNFLWDGSHPARLNVPSPEIKNKMSTKQHCRKR